MRNHKQKKILVYFLRISQAPYKTIKYQPSKAVERSEMCNVYLILFLMLDKDLLPVMHTVVQIVSIIKYSITHCSACVCVCVLW